MSDPAATTNTSLQLKTGDVVTYLRSNGISNAKAGIILGTGSGAIADAIDATATVAYADVPHLPRSTAIGHKGQFVFGTLAGQQVIAMQGRFHLYEGYDVDTATLPVHVMAALGIELLCISNAAGGVNTNRRVGDLMLINSHVDFMYRATPALGRLHSAGRPSIRSDVYSCDLISDAMQHARDSRFPLYEGVYAAMMGPNYETRAEYRFLGRIGADAVGMSTVPEVAVASQYLIRVMAASIITNVANPDSLAKTSGEEVVDAAAIAAPKLLSIVKHAIAGISINGDQQIS